MKDKLPVDYTDYPTAYVGQPRRFPSEMYGDFPDRSNPDAPAGQDGNRPPAENAAFGPLDTEGATGGKADVEENVGPVVAVPPTAWSGDEPPPVMTPEQQKKRRSIVWRQGPIP